MDLPLPFQNGNRLNDILQDASRESLIQAIEENLDQLLQTMASIPGVESHQEPGLTWLISDIPIYIINSIWRSRLDQPATEEAIRAAMARATKRNVDIVWWISPSDTPSNLNEWLEGSGFHGEQNPGMVLDLSRLASNTPSPERLTIQTVTDTDSLHTWSQVFTQGFELPTGSENYSFDWMNNQAVDHQERCRNYLAWLDGTPVAIATLFPAAGVAGIYNVATIAGARRMGIGTAITHAALLDAQAEGFRYAVLEASALGVPVYRRLGFEEYCQVGGYMWSTNLKSLIEPAMVTEADPATFARA